ncbi:MAG TPA: type II toxin-antitoxin system RelE/ParE family toxin [Patescibacteria group bacterium]|nr:type II toxin-antitoxin system RelE/ParE family toxin [Patescibacteria group bacterium]
MKVILTHTAERDFQRLSSPIRKKALKQLHYLAANLRHPSLRVKKMAGSTHVWEARIDYHYRFTFQKNDDSFIIRKFGPHDEGLGKP